jgi:RNA polymerase sigma factor (TIGR02999 family)
VHDGSDLTVLLRAWRKGDPNAAERVMELAYSELRKVARHHMRGERSDHTLSATALVNELYVRLAGSEPIDWQNRAHFFAVAATQLRRILVNHARDRQAQKRGGKQVKLAFAEVSDLAQPQQLDVLRVDEALTELASLDKRACQVVELRYFAGLTEAEAAEALGISLATVKRDWTWARAWLIANLKRSR